MLHALLRDGRHPRDQFIVRCGGVVVCARACDEGPSTAPPADPAAIPVAPAELDVAVDVRGLAPTPPDSGVYVTMVVAAHNRSDNSWVVQLPPSGDAGAPVSFAYRLESAAGTSTWFSMCADAPEVTRFAPGEVKRFVFDFFVHGERPSTRYELAPGTWSFHGAFGGVWAPRPPTLVLNP